MTTGDQLGERTVLLAHDVCVLVVLRELHSAPGSAKDIYERTDGVTLADIGRGLRVLRRNEFVLALDETGRKMPPNARASRNAVHELSEIGPALGEMVDEAERWERRWCRSEELGVPGMLALGFVADPASRTIVRTLADGPLRRDELRARVPELTRSVLRRHINDLRRRRLVVRDGQGHDVSYRLSDAVRELATVLLRAAHCESLRATAEDRSLSADLWGLLHVVAPLAEIPTGLTGVLLVHVESSRIEDVYLSAAAGRITALAVPPVGEPQATAGASTLEWCDVFFGGDPAQIPTDAHPGLVSAIFLALTQAMHPSGPANLDE
jgi:DNA-binding HxlR family transcriptional regulator